MKKIIVMSFAGLLLSARLFSAGNAPAQTIDVKIPECGVQVGWGKDIRLLMVNEKILHETVTTKAILIGVDPSTFHDDPVMHFFKFEIHRDFSVGTAVRNVLDKLNLVSITSEAECRIIRATTITTLDPRIVMGSSPKVFPGDILILNGLLFKPK